MARVKQGGGTNHSAAAMLAALAPARKLAGACAAPAGTPGIAWFWGVGRRAERDERGDEREMSREQEKVAACVGVLSVRHGRGRGGWCALYRCHWGQTSDTHSE